MIAVIKIGGHQFLTRPGEKIKVDKLSQAQGEIATFPVLMLSEEDGTSFQIGTPFLENIFAEAKILSHARGEKIRIFKMKPKKRYRRTQGHRQEYTEIEITKIGDFVAPPAVQKKEMTKETKTVQKTTKKDPEKKKKETPKKPSAKKSEKKS